MGILQYAPTRRNAHVYRRVIILHHDAPNPKNLLTSAILPHILHFVYPICLHSLIPPHPIPSLIAIPHPPFSSRSPNPLKTPLISPTLLTKPSISPSCSSTLRSTSGNAAIACLAFWILNFRVLISGARSLGSRGAMVGEEGSLA